MDIQHLVDRLDQILNDSYRVPLSAYLLVHEDQIFTIIDQMRVAVPEEVKRANRIEAEKDRILAQAQEESERIRELAKQEAAELMKRDAIMSSAQQRADNILERARRDGEALRQDADAYVAEVLMKLEEDLMRSLAVVQNGLHQVKDGHAPIAPPAQVSEE
ncbi:MAG: ATP synthase F0 subunit B [Chloroflexi bacterium]|nr:ATP synthase F0 subunit B [Chloroflexota bacterium]